MQQKLQLPPCSDAAESLFSKLSSQFESASFELSDSHQRKFNLSFAGHQVFFHSVGESLYPQLFSAFGHISTLVPNYQLAKLRVFVVDTALTTDFSPYELVKGLALKNRRVLALSNDRIFTSYEPESNALSVLDSANCEAYVVLNSNFPFSVHLRATPFVSLLHLSLRGLGVQLLHAAAVACSDKALVLAGRGGSGKSTTALSAVACGMNYLADDYCLFTTAEHPEAFSLYSSAKVHAANLERVSALNVDPVNLAQSAQEKALFYLDKHFPNQVVTKSRLSAIVVPKIEENPSGELREISPVSAMKALAPSTIFQLPEPGAHSFKDIVSLVKAVPAYELSLVEDQEQNVEMLRRVLS